MASRVSYYAFLESNPRLSRLVINIAVFEDEDAHQPAGPTNFLIHWRFRQGFGGINATNHPPSPDKPESVLMRVLWFFSTSAYPEDSGDVGSDESHRCDCYGTVVSSTPVVHAALHLSTGGNIPLMDSFTRESRPKSSTLRWEISLIAEMTALLGHGYDVDNNSNELSRASDAEPHQTAPNSNSKTQPHSFNNPPPTKQKHLPTASMLFTTQIVALTLAFAAHTGASTSKPAPAEGVIASPKPSTTGAFPATITQVTPAHSNITEVIPAHADIAEVTPAANATTGVPPTTSTVTAVVPTGPSLPSHDSLSLPVAAGPPVHGDMSSGKCMCPPPLTPPMTNSTVDDDTPQGNNTDGNSTSTGTPSVLNSFSLVGFMAAGAVALAL
ncbi:hypothetical protein KEM48_005040 [Puccinia striiformis f. sp. tritici PST-130]|nr:hypothetical protein KEM48_005040 [Puccinia striiformis f. sp. tritici PST-130]